MLHRNRSAQTVVGTNNKMHDEEKDRFIKSYLVQMFPGFSYGLFRLDDFPEKS